MSVDRGRVMLTAMRTALPNMPSSKAGRIVVRLVQVAMLAYAAREAVRYIRGRNA